MVLGTMYQNDKIFVKSQVESQIKLLIYESQYFLGS
jgi:hypothetical protein